MDAFSLSRIMIWSRVYMIAMTAVHQFTGFLDTNPLSNKRVGKEEEQKEILFGYLAL